MRTFLYPAILTPDTEHGGFLVSFPNLPEAITQGTMSKKHCIRPLIALRRPSLGGFVAASLFQRQQ
jgi:hypothetical protein